MTCVDVRIEAAAALLAGEEPDPVVLRHVVGCPDCAEELARLREVRGLLAAARPGAVPDPVPPDPALLGRLLAAAGAERRRRRLTWALAAGVALVLMLSLSIVVVGFRTSPAPPAPPASSAAVVVSASDTTTGVSGTVDLRPDPAGSAVGFAVTGVPAGTRCTMRVVTSDGAHVDAATWRAGYQGTARVTGSVDAPVARIARVDLVDADGRVLLRVPASPGQVT